MKDKQEDWIKRFNKKFVYSFRDRFDNYKYQLSASIEPKDIKQFIKAEKEASEEIGYWKRDKEQMESEEIETVERTHATKEGWCCACGYDMAVMEDKVKKSYELGSKMNIPTKKRLEKIRQQTLDELREKIKKILVRDTDNEIIIQNIIKWLKKP